MNSKSSFAFFLSIVIHASLFAGIAYLGLNFALPEGTVSSTEVEFIDAKVAQGSQTTDIQQQVTTVAKKPAPKPPPPAPKVEEVVEEIAEDVPEDIPMLEEQEAQVEDKLLEELAQDMEESDQLPEKLEPVAEPEPVVNNEPKLEDSLPPKENLLSGNSAVDESKYGTHSGIASHTQLSPVPGNVPPEYPMLARLRRHQGTVELVFDVNPSGQVENVEVVRSSGYEILDSAAIEAHKKWRYRPGRSGKFSKPYTFSLSGEAKEMPSQLRRQN